MHEHGCQEKQIPGNDARPKKANRAFYITAYQPVRDMANPILRARPVFQVVQPRVWNSRATCIAAGKRAGDSRSRISVAAALNDALNYVAVISAMVQPREQCDGDSVKRIACDRRFEAENFRELLHALSTIQPINKQFAGVKPLAVLAQCQQLCLKLFV